MASYPRLSMLVQRMNEQTSEELFLREVIPYLVGIWLDEYDAGGAKPEIVETTAGGFSYLFDIVQGRLIAAWGISRGKHDQARPKARMARHPLSAGPVYHRGHAVPHTLGGGTDINLVAQRGSVNVGAFRVLEIRAVATPGALYFTHWTYGKGARQTPMGVEQGLLVPGRPPEIVPHVN